MPPLPGRLSSKNLRCNRAGACPLPDCGFLVVTVSMDEQTARRDIVRIGQLMYERSYVVSSDGNISARLSDGRVVATPTMTCKGRMTEDSLAITDLEGRALNDRRASSELEMH